MTKNALNPLILNDRPVVIASTMRNEADRTFSAVKALRRPANISGTGNFLPGIQRGALAETACDQ